MDKCHYPRCTTNIRHLGNRHRPGERDDVHRETSVGLVQRSSKRYGTGDRREPEIIRIGSL